MRQRGIALVYSSNVETDDTREGVRLLEASVASGSVDALVTLGSLYLYGTVIQQDWPKALEYFEKAAAAGNGNGIYQYGMAMMWSEKDPAEAEAMLVRAGEMGVGSAWSTLAEGAMYGYLGGGARSRGKFAGYAERGRAVGNDRIEVLDAQRHMWGISVSASGPETIAMLERAAASGNSQAAIYLIKLVRSGNGLNVMRRPADARQYLDQYRPLLADSEAWQLDVSIQAAVARSRDAYSAVAQQVIDHPELVTKGFGADLLKANSNAAIFALQRKLAGAGYEIGQPDGFAGRRTLRAMDQACRKLAPIASCDDSVMRPDVVSLLIEQL